MRDYSKQLSLIQLSEDEVVEIIRPEENLERFSNFIFPHSRTKGLDQSRRHEWPMSLPDGRDAVGAITIDPSSSGKAYTYRTYDVYLALVAIWNEKGQPEKPFNTSLNEIARRMDVPANGRWLKNILDDLECLYKTTVSWSLSYTTDKKYQTVKNQQILDTFDYASLNERYELDDRFDKVCRIRFDENIRNNLRELRTIPVNWTARKSITSSVARVLYSRLDNIMIKTRIYERKGINLISDLMLTANRYKYKSQREQLLKRLEKQLNGVRLSNLRILQVSLNETVDFKDWKLVFKTRSDKKERKLPYRLPVVNKNPDERKMLIQNIAEVVGDLDKNYKLYNLFALHYSINIISRSLGEFKELTAINKTIKNKPKYFTATLHAIAHKMGKEWIKDCGPTCKHRPENNN